MSRWMFVAAVAAGASLLVGCASKEEPARQAVAAEEAALNEVRADAQKYVPQELHDADATLAKLKQEIAQEDFKAALTGAPELGREVRALKETLVARQTQEVAATHEWERLSEEVPKMVEAIQNRVDNLSGAPLPKEVSKESVETAKSKLEEMKAQWAEATAAFNSGNATSAADKGRAVESKGKELSVQLGVSPA